MTEFLKMDIFFVVTTVIVVLVGIVALMLALRIWKILGHVENILQMAEQETGLIKEDIAQLRADVRRNGFKISGFIRFLNNLRRNFTKGSRT